MKRCIRCGIEQPLDAYYPDTRFGTNRLRPACKTCIGKAHRIPKKRRSPQPKRCTRCRIVKPPHEFYPEKRKTDGLRGDCKICFNAQRAEYGRAYGIVWRAAHPERVRELNKQNRPKRDIYTKQWKKEHPDLVRMQHARKRAKRRSNAGIRDLTHAQWIAIKAAYRNCCAYCGEKRKRLTMDHVVPLVKGGAHTAANVVPACGRCNSRKKEFDPPNFQPMLVH